MNITKHLEFFDPSKDVDAPIHVIGCGAIGSTLIEMFARLGIPELNIYDFDLVEPANIANQTFFHSQLGMKKTEAISLIAMNINPLMKLNINEAYIDQRLAGYVFLCVDNIDLRRNIVLHQKPNPYIKAMFDFRMRLTDAQHYAASWADPKSIDNLLSTMAFSHEEAKEATPVNACGSTLSIIPTVRTIVSYGVTNFINFTKGEPLKKMILVDTFHYTLDAF